MKNKFLFKIFIELVFCILFFNTCLFANNLPSNLEVIDSITNQLTNKLNIYIKSNLKSNNSDTLILKYNKNNSSKYLVNYIIKNCKDFVFLDNDSSNKYITIDLIIKDFGIKYTDNKNDSLHRNTKVNFTGNVIYPNGIITSLPDFSDNYTDKIPSDSYQIYQNPEFEFTCSDFTPEEKSFYKKIIEPTILVSAAIISVVLLFTMRSN